MVQVLEHSGFVARYDWEGVYAVAASRAPRDVRGQTLAVRFQIIDKRPRSTVGGRNATGGPYNVAVRLQVRTAIPCLCRDLPLLWNTVLQAFLSSAHSETMEDYSLQLKQEEMQDMALRALLKEKWAIEVRMQALISVQFTCAHGGLCRVWVWRR